MKARFTLPLAACVLLTCAPLGQAQDPHAGHNHGPVKAVKLPPHAGGKLVVESPSFDAGTVERGGKVTHSFVIKNTGTGPLHVDAKPG